MLLHQAPRVNEISWLLSMSYSIEYPSLLIYLASNQELSSIGRFFHLTKYCKYSFRRVRLATRVSNICSISRGLARGICLTHVSVSPSPWVSHAYFVELSSKLVVMQGYMSTTLKMGEISIPGGSCSSYALAENFHSV